MAEVRTELQPAAIADRVFARVIDGVILLVPSLLMLGLASWISDHGATVVSVVGMLSLILVDAAYEIGFLALRGQTPGKKYVGLKVLRMGSTETPTWAQSAARYATFVAITQTGPFTLLRGRWRESPFEWIGLVLTIVLIAAAVRDPLKRAFHDKTARTIVVDLG